MTLIHLDSITKAFGQTIACSSITLDIEQGDILCIAGENGAGKSTLMRMLRGLETPDSGSISFMGQEGLIKSPSDALALGIGMVHQHFMLASSLTVAQNASLGSELRKGLFLDMEAMNAKVQAIIDECGFTIKATSLIDSLSVGEKQQAEILKLLFHDSKVLILDEPTAVLTDSETARLFDTLRALKAKGKTIILITHKMNEVLAISDKVAILRQGMLAGLYRTADMNIERLSSLLFGTILKSPAKAENPEAKAKKPVLVFDDVCVKKRNQKVLRLDHLSFTLHEGEILGFAAMEGNGIGFLEAVLGGFLPIKEGRIISQGLDITNFSSRKLRQMGLCYVPSDRMSTGSCQDASVMENLIIADRKKFFPRWVLDTKASKAFSDSLISQYSVQARSEMMMKSLSGGNIQKAILARELSQNGPYIVFAQPTWGLDIASTAAIWDRMKALRDSGRAILLLSSNLTEILALCDRVAVLCKGHIERMFINDASLNARILGSCMLGSKEEEQ